MNLVECKDVCKSYGNKQVLDHVTFTIEPGKIIGLLGPNGSGKSTIIKMINQLLTPDSGEILVNDKPLGIESKKVISYLPERSYLNFNVKVIELMDFFEDFYEDFDRKTAESLIEKLKINPKDKLKTMSKGTKEKVQLIMVMSRKADLYILDEPIGGVDPAARDYILTTILSNFNEGASILISTHLIADVEKILDEVIFISEGKVLLQQSADELRNEKQQSIDGVFREVFKC
ncbi:MAG TPA: ABC transporter ATP-binding protein [Candidatus Fimihabitans intestinipullorum]|uniref:ABC transporter ATP-binding protein n=1 Tax=Candidatus Fimihabitans intestinipullorum TaxID=2840820 RepID=A0A9D1L265_9BACT|nr:ABC transporter ATP-binding protein [Candidatus Fimihabitans intestinipullorum]